ncbi:alpha-amylase family protein [Tautonia plasticadhaerens]|uniref:Alpha-amylase n=1 Tax=Tautonia plasticadhaerens TaxID=2527974 RepID=A0A518HFM7_9BACT|nr:alpha-amylase family protein [Tautonia plasticadhaerens]QDV39631.1 Trehalose synthase/amylase TreS [Tautonia plasticadhaerens]
MGDTWYKEAVVYAVDVRTFRDSDGDGVGDFPGLTSRIDYLAELGITCLWLLPFYPSPARDNGYDVRDYYGVDPRLGTLEDFEEFLRRAGERGLRVVLDLIMNHTSDEHPWFQAARRDPGSRFRDYYVWAVSPPPPGPGQQSIFPGEEQTVWTFDERAGAHYYHRFYHFQPELRVANPEVRDEIRRVMDFWLSFPIAGFRLDAASHMIEDKGLPGTAPEQGHGVLKELHDFAAARRPGTALIGEADVPLHEAAAFFGDGDQLSMVFNFLLDNDLFLALATGRAEPIARCLGELPAIPEGGQWLNFLRNLDELDLERLSDEERRRVYESFAPDDSMRIFGRGIRRRLAPMLGGDRRRLELAFSLLLTLQGTPVIAYGDEIGMGDDLSLEGRDAVRTPMQWHDAPNAGFSDAPADRLIRPVIDSGPFAYDRVNVAAQQADPDSLLNWMKRAIAARRACPELGRGQDRVLPADRPSVLAHLVDWKGSRLVAVHNLGGEPCTATVEMEGHGTDGLERVFGPAEEEAVGSGHRFRLDAFGYGWFRAGATD